jgi:hypothetical protein
LEIEPWEIAAAGSDAPEAKELKAEIDSEIEELKGNVAKLKGRNCALEAFVTAEICHVRDQHRACIMSPNTVLTRGTRLGQKLQDGAQVMASIARRAYEALS